ncbi:MAG: hypothetical protein ACREV5_12630 [Steroidobacter sp.]
MSNDIFLKDLGVAALKLVPTGPTLVDINQGIPRSTVLRAMRRSLGHGLSTASFLLFGHRGFKPALEMHMSLKRRDEFTPEGRQRSFRGIAELIEANPTYLGAFGTSWYYDPALASVSPRLAYVRDEPARHGARFAYVGVDDNITRSALGKSATRSALFAEGKYRPCAYMLIWPKRDLIAYQLADR